MTFRFSFRRLLGRCSQRSSIGVVAVVAIGLLLAGLHLSNYPALSPLDEVHHFDNVVKESAFHLVRRGDALGPDALRVMACRGIDAPGYVPPPCVPPNVPPVHPDPSYDINISYMHPPLYYAMTGIVARAIRATGVVSSLLVAARFTNALWFVLGLVVLFGVMGELGLRGSARVAAALTPALIPLAVFQAATVTNDVTAIPSAALILLAVLKFDRRRWPAWTIVAACALAMMLRMTNVFGVCVGLAYLIVRSVQSRDTVDRSRLTRAALLGGLAAGITGLIWVATIGAVARVPSSAIPLADLIPKHFSLWQLLDSIPPLVPPTYALPDVTFWSRHRSATLIAAAIGWPVLTGPALAVARRHRQQPALALGLAAGASMIAAGPALVVINAISSDSFLGFPPPTRMALSVVPGCLAAALGGIRSTWAQRSLIAFVGIGLAGMLVIVADIG